MDEANKTHALEKLIETNARLIKACQFFLKSLESRKRGGLAPCLDFSDWDTVAYCVKTAVASDERGSQ